MSLPEPMLKNRLSFITLAVIFIVICTIRFSRPQWEKNEIIMWDVFGYYLYLPSAFIYDDVRLQREGEWLTPLIEKYKPTPMLYQALHGPQGNKVFYYTGGLAILYSPFFLIAHASAEPLGHPADGLSLPYQLSIAMGCLLYTLIGLIFLRKILLRFFDDAHVSIIMLLLAFGTNYLHLTAFEGIMPHNNIFMLYTLIIWFTIRWHEDHKLLHVIILGAAMALAILSRGSEIVSIFIPLLWGIKDKETLRAKVRMVWKYKWHVAVLAAVMFITATPQLKYWKMAAGKWIYDSYGDAGFSFSSPYILEVLISYKKGWLVYTPIMIFALLGFIPLWKRRRDVFWSAFVFFILNFYIVSSWDVWWYAASYGQRALVQSYAMMMIPFGMFVWWVRDKSFGLKAAFYSMAVLLTALNIFQLWQFSRGIIDIERMTKNYYWEVFLQTSVTEEERKLLEVDRSQEHLGVPDNGKEYDHYVLKVLNFDDASELVPKERLDTFTFAGKHSIRLDSTYLFSPNVEFVYEDITEKDHLWLRITAYVYSNELYERNPASLIVTFMNRGKHVKYSSLDLEKKSLQPKQWNKITMDYITPFIINEKGQVKIYVWHRGKQPLWVDDLTVEVFEPKVLRE